MFDVNDHLGVSYYCYSVSFLWDEKSFRRCGFSLTIFEQDTGNSPGEDCYSCIHQQGTLPASRSEYGNLVKEEYSHSCGNHKLQQRQGMNHAS